MHAASSEAALLEFVHEWRVLSSDTATATGRITIDESFLMNPGYNSTSDSPFVVAFSITIAGASAGNGTFVLSDFGQIWLDTGLLGLDFSQELVGQATEGGSWGCFDYDCGDFGMSGASGSSAPIPVWFFAMATNGGDGDFDLLELTSFRPVPIPSALWLFGSGLLGLIGISATRN